MEALKDTLLVRELKSLDQNNNTKKHTRSKIGNFGLDILKSAPKRTFTGVFCNVPLQAKTIIYKRGHKLQWHQKKCVKIAENDAIYIAHAISRSYSGRRPLNKSTTYIPEIQIPVSMFNIHSSISCAQFSSNLFSSNLFWSKCFRPILFSSNLLSSMTNIRPICFRPILVHFLFWSKKQKQFLL